MWIFLSILGCCLIEKLNLNNLLEMAPGNIAHNSSVSWQCAFDMFRTDREQKVQNVIHLPLICQCANGLPEILTHESLLQLKTSPCRVHVTQD